METTKKVKAPLVLGGRAKNTKMAFFSFAVPPVILLLVFALAGIWPFGGNTVLTGDLGGIYLQVMASLRQSLLSGEGIFYSFSKSLGGEMFSSYASYADLTFMPVLLLVPLKHLPDALLINYLLKAGVTGLAMYFFLSRRKGANPFFSMLLGWCYALCGYVTAYLQNVMWLNALWIAPLVLYCVENWQNTRCRFAYTFLLALAVFCNYYTGWMLCLFVALYWLYNLLSEPQGGVSQRFYSLRRAGSFGFYSVLAGGLCAVVLVPVLAVVGSAKGGLFSLDTSLARNFSLFSLPEELVIGRFTAQQLSGWLPLIYCGLAAMLLAAAYFFVRGIPLRQKLLSAGVLAVFFLSFWLQLPNIIWHGFKSPVWFYFRYSFLCVLFLLVLANDAAARLRQVPKAAGILLPVLLCALVAFAFWRNPEIPLVKVVASLLVIVCAAGCFWLFYKTKNTKIAAVLLMVLVVSELFMSAGWTQKTMEFKARDTYMAQAENLPLLLEKTGENAPYRAEKEWFYTLNDPQLYNYKGVSFFNSVQDDETLQILRDLGFVTPASTVFGLGAGGNPAANRLLGLRYRLADEETAPPANYKQVAAQGGYTLWEDTAALPMAFAAGAAVQQVTFAEDAAENQNRLYSALTGVQQPVLVPVDEAEKTLLNLSQQPDETLPGVTAYTVQNAQKEAAVVYTFAMPYTGTLCLLLDSPDFVQVYPRANSVSLGGYGSADKGGFLNCGFYTKGQTVTLEVGIGADMRLGEARLYCERQDVQQMHRDALLQQGADKTKVYNGRLYTTVTALPGQLLFTTIPAAKGWHAVVNGQDVQPIAVAGGFLALPLSAGECEVELFYTPPGLGAGVAVSAVALCVYLGAFLLALYRRKKRKQIK